MNEEKSGKVVKLTFKNEWSPNPNQTLYVHEIEFDNGDKGSIYAKSKLPNEIQAGESIVYTFSNPEHTKVKYIGSLNSGTNIANPPNQAPQINYGAAPQQRTHYAKSIGTTQNNNNRNYMSASKGLEGNIGYAHSYAKDVLETIYKQYGELLKDRKKELLQRMMDGKQTISDLSLEKMFNEDILMYLKMGRLVYEQMGYLVSAGYDGRVNVEEELRAMIELNVLAPLRKDLGVEKINVVGSGNAKGEKSTIFENGNMGMLNIIDDTDFDIEEPKEDDFLKEMNEDFDSFDEDKKGKKKK